MSKLNIIFIILDTLRDDYSEKIFKEIKKFGFIKYSAISPSPWTFPSHASIFTGEYPSIHGAHETKTEKGWGIRLKYRPLLTHDLKDLGYNTYLFTANPYIRPSLGFSGFDYFYETVGWSLTLSLLSHDDIIKIRSLKRMHGISSKKSMLGFLLCYNRKLLTKIIASKMLSPATPLYKRVIAKIKNWPLDKGISEIFWKFNRIVDFSRPFFVFMNLLEIHEPYSLTDDGSCVKNAILKGVVDKDCLHIWQKGYNKEVEYISLKLREFIESLEDKNILFNTLFIITSDHGQLLGEHNLLGHGYTLHDEVLNVPLLIKYPSSDVQDDSEAMSLSNDSNLISLTSLRKFIISAALNSRSRYQSNLYSEIIFAESFGIGGLSVIPKSCKERKMVDMFEKHRIAVYHGPYKGIYNVDDKILECVKSYDGSEITKDVKDMLIKDVKKFLKQARLKSAVRKIKLKKSL